MREQTQLLHTADHRNVEEVKNYTPQRSRNPHNRYSPRDARDKRGSPRVQSTHNCTRCGQTKHEPGDRSRAKKAICKMCDRRSHYAAVCFSKTVAASAQEVEAEDQVFLGALISSSDTSWTSTLRSRRVQFKLDTGAEVTASSETTSRPLGRIPLQKASNSLQGQAGQSLTVLGQFMRKISLTKISSNEVILSYEDSRTIFLGFLLSRICTSSRRSIRR